MVNYPDHVEGGIIGTIYLTMGQFQDGPMKVFDSFIAKDKAPLGVLKVFIVFNIYFFLWWRYFLMLICKMLFYFLIFIFYSFI